MPTPYARAPEEAPAPPRLVRPVQGRVLAGVCLGIAVHLGVPVVLVRVVTVALALSGAGVVGYLFLWALTPQGDVDVTPEQWARRTSSPARPVGPDAAWAWVVAGGIVLVVLGLAWLGEQSGLDLRLGIVVPAVVIGLGAVVAFSLLDEAQRSQWLGSDRELQWQAVTRLGLGIVLASIGIIWLASRGASLSEMVDVALAVVAVLVGAAVISAPWVMRFWGDLRQEQAARARADERADIAAHLHDSVLQTLALIQRQSSDPGTVSRLARAQERELRSWLYAGAAGTGASLAAAVARVTAEVEDVHGIPVDLVSTGDQPIDPHGEALVRALREAVVNAVRHGSPPVSVYLEVTAGGVDAFVRDHGDGFDPSEVPADRLGIRESIVGRMERHGGTARVRHLEAGTEVALTLPPLPPVEDPPTRAVVDGPEGDRP